MELESGTISPPNPNTSTNVRRYPQRHCQPKARFCDEQLFM